MINAKGFGETRPLVPNDTEEHKRMNRRVEFEVWLDPKYDGPMVLPTADEFVLDDEEEYFDPEFMEEEIWDWEAEDLDFDWDWDDEEDDDDLLKEFDDFAIDDPDK